MNENIRWLFGADSFFKRDFPKWVVSDVSWNDKFAATNIISSQQVNNIFLFVFSELERLKGFLLILICLEP